MISDVTLQSAKYLCDSIETKLPIGETNESVCELLSVHVKEVTDLKQCRGKSATLVRLERMLNRYAILKKKHQLTLIDR